MIVTSVQRILREAVMYPYLPEHERADLEARQRNVRDLRFGSTQDDHYPSLMAWLMAWFKR